MKIVEAIVEAIIMNATDTPVLTKVAPIVRMPKRRQAFTAPLKTLEAP